MDRYGLLSLARAIRFEEQMARDVNESKFNFPSWITLFEPQVGMDTNEPKSMLARYPVQFEEQTGPAMNEPKSMVSSFSVPFEGQMGIYVNESKFDLPSCFVTRPLPQIIAGDFEKFNLKTLFYIFHNFPGDVMQALTAAELYKRQWRYHKQFKLWFTKHPSFRSIENRTSYVCFDINSWECKPYYDNEMKLQDELMKEQEIGSIQIPAHFI